ncbi:MAG: sortase [Chloroflexota bacterium]
MSSSSSEGNIPVSLFFIAIGLIAVVTAGLSWFILNQLGSNQTAEALPTAVSELVLPTETAVPPAEDEDDLALLPETPLESTPYPDHFVNALEAAQPNVGQPVRLIIPEIELDAPINPIGLQAIEHEGDTVFQWQVPSDFIAGWHHSSSRIGQNGNTVLNGHHNIHGEIFRDLDELEVGAEITLFDPLQSYSYTVSEVLIIEERDQPLEVRLENAQWIEHTDDERLTLVTCWPYTDNSHRLIVVAHPTETDAES